MAAKGLSQIRKAILALLHITCPATSYQPPPPPPPPPPDEPLPDEPSPPEQLTVGTTLADYADRSLGVGYAGGSVLLSGLLLASLFVWKQTLGSVAVDTVSSPTSEVFYWVIIMFSQTLGTALGDWVADTQGLGYLPSAVIFGSLLTAIALAYYHTRISHTVLFWAAFILSRPLGAVVGDFLDKPLSSGGLELSRYSASATLMLAIVLMILAFKHRSAQANH